MLSIFDEIAKGDFRQCVKNTSMRKNGSTRFQDNLRRFKKETYHFVRRDDIIHFFANFEDFWSEDHMWDVSERIKPRGQKVGK